MEDTRIIIDIEESGDVKSTAELSPLDVLDNDTKKVAEDIVKEQNVDRVKDLTNIFNLNNQKKNILRILTYNDLIDIVGNQISERLHKHPDEISNKELMEMLTTLQTCVEKSQKTIDTKEIQPLINIQKNEINVNGGETITKESREKILDVVNKILKASKETEVKEENIVEVDTSKPNEKEGK